MQESAKAERAIVIGGGMGGLTAAAALAPHFSEVILLERDDPPETPQARSGVPQGKHVHGLLGGGLEALSQLFPGFTEALIAAGAVPFRLGLDVRLEQVGYDPFPQRDLRRSAYSMSRPLLEHVVREFVTRDQRITQRSSCAARTLLAAPDRRAVNAVRVETRGGSEETLGADLVIDATGRAALTLDFLEKNGYGQPEESSVPVDIRYTSGVFELPSNSTRDWTMLLTRPDFNVNGRRAIMFPIEGPNHWILGLGGVNGDSAPPDLDGFLAYARTLRTPTAFDAVIGATLKGDLARFAFPKSYRRHFERMKALPRGLVPIGDSICRINPSFGQGMSVAVKEAVLLGKVVSGLDNQTGSKGDVVSAFMERLESVLADPWAVAFQDYAYPHLESQRPAAFGEQLKIQAAVTRLAAQDPEVHRLMTEVGHLLRPSSDLRHPDITARLAI